MDFGLSGDQREIQRTARELLAERARPERVRACAESGRADEELWRELSTLGWPGIALGERYGGQGLGVVELSILCEELGASVAAVPFLPSVLAATLIAGAGSDEQRERLLPGLASGQSVGAIGAAADGRAELILGGPDADVLVLLHGEDAARVYAVRAERTGEGSDLEADGADRDGVRASGIELEAAHSIDPTRACARAGAVDPVAGEELAGDVEGALQRALVAIAAELVGVCGRALAMTVAYVKERRQFGVPVGAYQAVSHRCAQMLLDTERARSATAYAAWAADADPELLPRAAAMAKASASEAAVEVCASAIQCHGGIGFTWEADLHWLYKRALIDAALLGGAKRQRARLAALL